MLFAANTHAADAAPRVACAVCGTLTRTPIRVTMPPAGAGDLASEPYSAPVCGAEHAGDLAVTALPEHRS